MKCKNCSSEISFNTTRCVSCGAMQEPIILRITPEEAKEGCKKRVHAPFMANTILVSLQPGVRKGMTFQLQNAQILYEDGETKTEPVYVRVSVGKIRGGQYAYKKKKIVWPWILMASILLLAGTFVFLLSQGIFSFESQMPTEEPSTEPSVEQEQTEPTTTAPKIYYEPIYEIPHFEERVFLSQLDEDLYFAFCALYDSVMAFEPDCTIPGGVDSDSFTLLLHLLNMECPEIMQIDFSKDITYYENAQSGLVESVQWNYTMDQETYFEKVEQCQDVVNALIATTEGMPEADKHKIVFDYLANSCTYAAEGEDISNAYGAMVLGNAKCDGISLAYKWIMEDMGYRCFCLFGEPVSGGMNHAWNVVEVDGTFLDMDVTADVRYTDRKVPILYQAYKVSNTWIRSQYKLNPVFEYFSDIPGTDSMAYSYYTTGEIFVPAGTEFDETFARQLFLACDGRGYLALQFESKTDMMAFVENLSSYMNTQAVAQDLYGWSWESATFEAYQVVYIKVTKN